MLGPANDLDKWSKTPLDQRMYFLSRSEDMVFNLMSEQTLYRPVESYESVVGLHNYRKIK